MFNAKTPDFESDYAEREKKNISTSTKKTSGLSFEDENDLFSGKAKLGKETLMRNQIIN